MVMDMLKIESPFIRHEVDGDYIVSSEIAEGYEWVFNDKNVLAIEKLDGTNVSIIIEDGVVKSVWNRTERIPFINKGKAHIISGILESFQRGYFELADGQFFGELIGKKVNGNPYKIDGHLWIPFATYARNHLSYTSWGKYPKTFDGISAWFEKDLFSLFIRRRTQEIVPPEGIVFTHPDGRLAKLRRDMFSWYTEPRHKE